MKELYGVFSRIEGSRKFWFVQYRKGIERYSTKRMAEYVSSELKRIDPKYKKENK